MEKANSLNEQVRRKLRVTWEDDDDTNARIDNDIIPNAEQDLINLLGIPALQSNYRHRPFYDTRTNVRVVFHGKFLSF